MKCTINISWYVLHISVIQSKEVGKLLQQQEKEGRVIAAICAAPTALKAHGIAKGKQVTSYPAMKDDLKDDYKYLEDKVVTDGMNAFLGFVDFKQTVLFIAITCSRQFNYQQRPSNSICLWLGDRGEINGQGNGKQCCQRNVVHRLKKTIRKILHKRIICNK